MLFINYHKIIVLLKQSPAAYRIHLPAGRRAAHTVHSAQNWLQTSCPDFTTKGPVVSKFAEYYPLDYHVWGAMSEAYRKLKTS